MVFVYEVSGGAPGDENKTKEIANRLLKAGFPVSRIVFQHMLDTVSDDVGSTGGGAGLSFLPGCSLWKLFPPQK